MDTQTQGLRPSILRTGVRVRAIGTDGLIIGRCDIEGRCLSTPDRVSAQDAGEYEVQSVRAGEYWLVRLARWPS